MNGSNANTSGSTVANVGYLPKGLLEKLTTAAGIVWKNLVLVVKGEAVVATVDFSVKSGSDLLPDVTLEEIARRLIVTLELKAQGNVIFSPTAPDDLSKAWMQTDPLTGIPLGTLKTWDATSQSWVAQVTVQNPYTPPQTRHFMAFASGPGQSQVTIEFPTMGTKNYWINMCPTTYQNGSWQPAPTTFPSHFGWAVVNKGESEMTINFFGTPEDGLNWEIDIFERPS